MAQPKTKALTRPNVSKIADESLFLRYVEEINRRGHLSEYSAFYFNIDGLDGISEQYGFKESRKVLRQYMERLLRFIENDEFLGQLDGDNVVALIKMRRTNIFRRYLEDVEVETVNSGNLITHRLGASCGIWEMSGEEIRDIHEVISNPAIAYIQAKYILLQDYVMLPPGMVAKANQQREVMDAFEDALNRGEFRVHYQPKIDAEKRQVVGAEALVRWYHRGKIISPGVFLRPLEQTGDVLQLDYFVLRTICEDIKSWESVGIEPVPVSVNFSRKNLTDEDLAENVDYIITKSGVDKKYVQLEIAEIKDSEEYEFMSEFLEELSARGIATAIDNFGSGFASLSALRKFKVDTVKIDRSFINTDDFSREDEIILTHIIQMAKDLGIEVVTQGVEREDQLNFVKNAGCNLIQGFFFDRPLPKEEFETRLSMKAK